ncbi:hypothetical protein [Paenibacillus sp.]|uniref:hypothetical protein n=1 Tax=Paenibacillus sp. TaxID=58172 RepID=UPI0028AB1564|nr:hypothetical protein [Paenibacillus sp.]
MCAGNDTKGYSLTDSVPLYEIGLGGKIETMFLEMLAGPGTVRRTLEKYLK